MTEQLTTAQQIVFDLAYADLEGIETDEIAPDCQLCDGVIFDLETHVSTCPYRRAVEYVESLKAGER